jgi:hypothetical protein
MSAETKSAISPVVAAHVLWSYDAMGGYEPGSFTRDLIKLIGRADPFNRAKLALGFAAYVAACEEIETPGGGVETLQAIARKPVCGRCRTAPVEMPNAARAGEPFFYNRFCASCIDRCHESTDFAHSCVICNPVTNGGAQ